MLPELLASAGLPVLVRAVGSALDQIDSPIAAGAASALREVQSAVGNGTIAAETVEAASRHVGTLDGLESSDFQKALADINQSLRAEVASEDAYVRRMRPTFGYVMAATWGVQMAAIAWSMIASPAQAAALVNAMASMGTIWSVGLAVLGVYVYKRSDDKRQQAALASGSNR